MSKRPVAKKGVSIPLIAHHSFIALEKRKEESNHPRGDL